MAGERIPYNKQIIDYCKIAKDLCYPTDILDKIRKAKTEIEIERIMHDARNGKR